MVKRILYIGLSLILMLSFMACGKEPSRSPDFPLSSDVIEEGLKHLGLSGTISEEKSFASDSQTSFLITGVCSTESGEGMTISVSSSLVEGKRYMQISGLAPPNEDSRFAWEEWRDVFSLAEILYGGFDDTDPLYQTFSKKEVPENEVNQIRGGRVDWEVNFTERFCKATYCLTGPAHKMTRTLSLVFFESEADYLETMEKRKSD